MIQNSNAMLSRKLKGAGARAVTLSGITNADFTIAILHYPGLQDYMQITNHISRTTTIPVEWEHFLSEEIFGPQKGLSSEVLLEHLAGLLLLVDPASEQQLWGPLVSQKCCFGVCCRIGREILSV